MCTYIYTCVYCVYIYIHIYIHTYLPTYIHTYIRTYIHTYMHACMHTYIHTYILEVSGNLGAHLNLGVPDKKNGLGFILEGLHLRRLLYVEIYSFIWMHVHRIKIHVQLRSSKYAKPQPLNLKPEPLTLSP